MEHYCRTLLSRVVKNVIKPKHFINRDSKHAEGVEDGKIGKMTTLQVSLG